MSTHLSSSRLCHTGSKQASRRRWTGVVRLKEAVKEAVMAVKEAVMAVKEAVMAVKEAVKEAVMAVKEAVKEIIHFRQK